MRVNDLASTPISPSALTGAGSVMPRANPSIARVICTSGRDSDRARKNTSGIAAARDDQRAQYARPRRRWWRAACGEGTASTTVMRGPPASSTVFQPIPNAIAGAILDDARRGVVAVEQRGELREVVLDPERRAELESEFAPEVGMNEIVAVLVHREEIALPPRVADAGRRPARMSTLTIRIPNASPFAAMIGAATRSVGTYGFSKRAVVPG